MTKTEIKKSTFEVLRVHGFKPVTNTIFINDQSIFICATISEWKDSSSVYEFYVNYADNYATKQTLCNCCVNEPQSVNTWFFKDKNY